MVAVDETLVAARVDCVEPTNPLATVALDEDVAAPRLAVRLPVH